MFTEKTQSAKTAGPSGYGLSEFALVCPEEGKQLVAADHFAGQTGPKADETAKNAYRTTRGRQLRQVVRQKNEKLSKNYQKPRISQVSADFRG